MSSIKLNTATMKSSGERIESISNYYSKKKSTFTSSAFGTGGKLGQFLTKLQKVYEDIGSNLKETNKVLKEYTEDIEGLEKQMSGGAGVVKAPTASSEVSKWKNSVKNIKIDESQVFQIQGYGNVRDERHKSMVEGAIGGLETVAGCGLAFMEGLGNLVEMLVDGGGMLAAGACSILGYEERAEEIGEFVARDISKEKYEEAMKDLGIDKYMDVDGTAAKVFSMAGNIVGMVGLSILTGGIAAEVFGAGTAAASTVTAVSNAGIQALNNMGSEGEAALQRGATVKEAEEVGLIAASVGAITGFVSGKIDAGARAIGAKEGSSGLGKICTKVLAAFGVGSSEPIINEIAHTAIYRQEEGESFKESFIKNASEDGLILQIAMAGGANALGTLGNGIGGIKRYNSLSRQIEEAMSGSGVTVIEIADKSEISPELMKKLGEGDLGKVEFKIGDEIYEIKGGGFFEKISEDLIATQPLELVEPIYVEEEGLFSGKSIKDKFKSMLNEDSKPSIKSLSTEQQNLLNEMKRRIARGEKTFAFRSTSEISSAVLENIDDLSDVKIQIFGGFADLNGNFKPKYNSAKYINRITYSGYEALSILQKLESFESMVDMDLPPLQRARQIYDIISENVAPGFDYANYRGGHEVAASLKGLTDNNSIGKQGLVCAGYAQTFKELCTRCGLTVDYIRGTGVTSAGSGAHAWNVVFDGGDYVPVDVTWKATSGSDWFGRSSKFASSHIADIDEMFKNYDLKVEVENVSQAVSSSNKEVLKSVIAAIEQKYGEGSGIHSLRKLVNTGNYDCITRNGNARAMVEKLDLSVVKDYLDIELPKEIVEDAIRVMDIKYGTGAGFRQVGMYLKTGNINCITSTNNARNNVSNLSISAVQNYFDNITNSKLDDIVQIMDQKYGVGTGISQLKAYLSSGNERLITGTNHAREIIKDISFDKIKDFLDSYEGR